MPLELKYSFAGSLFVKPLCKSYNVCSGNSIKSGLSSRISLSNSSKFSNDSDSLEAINLNASKSFLCKVFLIKSTSVPDSPHDGLKQMNAPISLLILKLGVCLLE